MSDTDDTAYETLTDPKHFSRLLYTNPVCFLTTVDAKRGRHVGEEHALIRVEELRVHEHAQLAHGVKLSVCTS